MLRAAARPAGKEATTHSTMVGSLSDLANQLVSLGVERVVMEATSDYSLPQQVLDSACPRSGVRPRVRPALNHPRFSGGS